MFLPLIHQLILVSYSVCDTGHKIAIKILTVKQITEKVTRINYIAWVDSKACRHVDKMAGWRASVGRVGETGCVVVRARGRGMEKVWA